MYYITVVKKEIIVKKLKKEINTLRKQLYNLRNNISSYRSMFNNSPEALLLITGLRISEINDNAVKLFGYKNRKELIGKTMLDISPEFQPDGCKSADKAEEMCQYVSKYGSHKFEWLYIRADGKNLHLKLSISSVKNAIKNHTFIVSVTDISEIKNIEHIIEESRSHFRSLMYQSALAIGVYSTTGKLMDMNKVYADLWNLDPEKSIGKFNILDTSFSFTEELRDSFLKACSGGIENIPESKYKTFEENTEKWLNTLIYPIENAFGEVQSIVVTHEDLTEKIKILNKLKYSEERFHGLIETANDIIWETDSSIRYTYVSPNVEQILGYRPDEMIGKVRFDFVDDRSKEKVYQVYSKYVLKDLPVNSIEIGLKKKDGTVINIEANAVAYFDSEGQLLGYRGIDRDNSVKKQFEDYIILSDVVFENSIEGIVITDAGGTIQKVNKAFTDITGYSEEEAIGQNPRILKSDRHDEAFYKEMWDSLIYKGEWSGEIWNRKKNGQVYPEWLSISAIKNPDNSVRNYISVFHDVTEKKLNEEKLEFLAYHDPLTKLPNRRLLYDRLKMSIEYAKRNKSYLALLFLDIDNFKHINDTYGHSFGDDFLCAVKDVINGICRSSDTFARYGGDEFVIILNGLKNVYESVEFAKRIISLFEKPIIVNGEDVYTSVSIGVSIYPDDGVETSSLEKNADIALYQAKKEGKRRYVLYRRELKNFMLKRNYIYNNLQREIEDFTSFSVFYQPKVIAGKNSLTKGVEALLRWKLEGDFIPPSEFIPIAEETGLIIPIGRWVMKKAMSDIKKAHDMGYDLTLSINLSILQFNDEKLFDYIEEALDDSGFNREKLFLEITESTPMGEVDNALEIMERISSMGINLSMDDFGTGYSSLNYLKNFPLKELKIDQTFVKDLPHDKKAAAICRTIIDIARSLNCNVVAEGVETKEQLDLLSENGCHLIQGFWFYKPMPFGKLIEELEREKKRNI